MTETPLNLSPQQLSEKQPPEKQPPEKQPEPQLDPPAPLLQSDSPRLAAGTAPIVFFDGECVLCNGFLDVMFAIDHKQALQVAPLQGRTAQALLPPLPHDPEDWSIYYLDDQGLYYQSEAVIQILQRLGGVWSLLSMGRIIPLPARDAAYRFVANNRYRWLGKREGCRVPTTAEKARFLP